MEPNDYVNRLRHAMEISENPRFSPEYIAQCCTYAENLLKQGLPVLFDQTHIRKVLGMAAPRLCDYHRFTIPKHNGISQTFSIHYEKTGPADLPEHGVQRIRRQYPV